MKRKERDEKRGSTEFEIAVDSLCDAFLGVLSDESDMQVAGENMAELKSERFADAICRSKGRTREEGVQGEDVSLVSFALQLAVLKLSEMAEERKCHVMKMKIDGSKGNEAMVPLFLDSALALSLQNSPPLDLSAASMCLETLMEITTTMDCVDIFDYLDSRLEMFTRQGVRQKSQYTLLRTCNVLLKRLSKSQDAALCGRVLVFLAKFLPLTERSGVNMYGTFHVENETPLEDVQEGALDANGMPIDTEFYRTFWGLQKWFSDPTSALTSGAWDTISESLNVVLKRFSAEPVTVTEAPGTSEDQAQDPSAAGDGSSVKYLSSARLLPLQIRDATFRRNFLIQSLILIGWIENPLLKDWASKKPTERVMNDLQFMKRKIIRHLKRIPEHGSSFAEAIRKVLDGEITWSIWKQAGCPSEPFQVPERKGLQNLESIALFDDSKKFHTSSEAVYGVELGVPELDRLWNLTEDNLSMLGADDRGGFNSLRQLMNPVIDEMNEPDDDDLFGATKDAVYNWKTLRLVARDSLATFAATVRAGGDLRIAARLLYPDDVPPKEEKRIDSMEPEDKAIKDEDVDVKEEIKEDDSEPIMVPVIESAQIDRVEGINDEAEEV